MDDPTRKRIGEIAAQLDTLRQQVETLAEDEREHFDNRNLSNLSEAESTSDISDAAEALEQATQALCSAHGHLLDAMR